MVAFILLEIVIKLLDMEVFGKQGMNPIFCHKHLHAINEEVQPIVNHKSAPVVNKKTKPCCNSRRKTQFQSSTCPC